MVQKDTKFSWISLQANRLQVISPNPFNYLVTIAFAGLEWIEKALALEEERYNIC
jgi:hypothetical protein